MCQGTGAAAVQFRREHGPLGCGMAGEQRLAMQLSSCAVPAARPVRLSVPDVAGASAPEGTP